VSGAHKKKPAGGTQGRATRRSGGPLRGDQFEGVNTIGYVTVTMPFSGCGNESP
jgi:hypothetical protein